MNKIKAIEKLRESIWDGHKTTQIKPSTLLTYLDVIEREVAEQFIESPKDADGVPWTQDDNVFIDESGYTRNIRRLAWNPRVKQWYLLDDDHSPLYLAEECRHVKERTVEDVLVRFLSSCGDDDPHFYDEEIRKYADELNAMLGRQ